MKMNILSIIAMSIIISLLDSFANAQVSSYSESTDGGWKGGVSVKGPAAIGIIVGIVAFIGVAVFLCRRQRQSRSQPVYVQM